MGFSDLNSGPSDYELTCLPDVPPRFLAIKGRSGQQTPRRWGWGTPLKKRAATRIKSLKPKPKLFYAGSKNCQPKVSDSEGQEISYPWLRVLRQRAGARLVRKPILWRQQTVFEHSELRLDGELISR